MAGGSDPGHKMPAPGLPGGIVEAAKGSSSTAVLGPARRAVDILAVIVRPGSPPGPYIGLRASETFGQLLSN
jgi:hypothetical protein